METSHQWHSSWITHCIKEYLKYFWIGWQDFGIPNPLLNVFHAPHSSTYFFFRHKEDLNTGSLFSYMNSNLKKHHHMTYVPMDSSLAWNRAGGQRPAAPPPQLPFKLPLGFQLFYSTESEDTTQHSSSPKCGPRTPGGPQNSSKKMHKVNTIFIIILTQEVEFSKGYGMQKQGWGYSCLLLSQTEKKWFIKS